MFPLKMTVRKEEDVNQGLAQTKGEESLEPRNRPLIVQILQTLRVLKLITIDKNFSQNYTQARHQKLDLKQTEQTMPRLSGQQ